MTVCVVMEKLTVKTHRVIDSQKEGAVEPDISRKTSEIWATRHLLAE
jgi:hypothetical protein